MLDLAQLLRVPQVDHLFDISPDYAKIAFAWNKTDEWQIYEIELSPVHRFDHAIAPLSAITSGPGGKFNPHYSPDGSKLAYVLDMDGSESYHLVVYDFITQQHTDLTQNVSHALQPNFCWSPDGSQLAFLSDKQGHFSTYILLASGGEPQLVLEPNHPAWQVEWSPDGKHLAVCCEMRGQDYGVFVVNLETKETVEIPLNAYGPKWSPDGRKLVFHSDAHGWLNIALYDMKTKEITWITDNDCDSQAPVFLSSRQIACTLNKGAINWVEIISDQGERKKYQIGQGIHNGIRFTSDLKRMVTTFSSPSEPPDLWIIDIESGESIQLTNSLPDGLPKDEFIMPEEIEYPSTNGVQIPALFYRSKQTPASAVVMIHGGPNWHYSAEWNPVIAHLASRGYVVLCPNYRGSTGYGHEWQYAAQFDLGGVDTRDVAAGAQYLLREGLANKVAVTGRSHGGYLTMTCLTQFPELWCTGSAVVPFTNWFKSHEDSREDLQHWNIENMGDPKENYEHWYNASPYFFLDKIQAPVQLICGGNDPRCPASDSIDVRDKLIELGKTVDFLLYEDEGHAFLKIENVIASEMRRVEFLAKALENVNK